MTTKQPKRKETPPAPPSLPFQEKQFQDNSCGWCGKKLWEPPDFEILDAMVSLTIEYTGHPHVEALAAWCSQEHMVLDIQERLQNRQKR